jgi:ADP-ribosyl-[dinitrogen reductase] hydrolase
MQVFRQEAVAGAILGGAIGDVLGGVAERRTLTISDDTQLTLATCEAIIDAGEVGPHAIALRMLAWFRAGRVSGIGSSTLKAMRDLENGVHWALAGARGERAAGNGAAMRIAPIAFLLNPDVPRERIIIRDVARITHHHDEAYAGALAVVLAIRSAATGRLPSASSLAAALPDSRVRDYLLRAARREEAPLDEIAREIGTSGFTPETVAMALVVTPRIVRNGLESAIHRLNEIGGDTDTIGSIAGQIAGAMLGPDKVPLQALDGVPSAEEVKRIAWRFAAAVTSSASR